MSDGNFNRSLLPSNNYQSGIRAGKSTMRQQALKAFKEILDKHFSELSCDNRKNIEKEFTEKITR